MTSTRTTTILAAGALGVVALAPPSADARTFEYVANLSPLNGSGVSGQVRFSVDRTAQTLRARANISGLVPSLPHVNHIHGRFQNDYVEGATNAPRNSVLPTADLDADGDGLIEVFEAAPAYGDVILSLEDPAPTPDAFHQGPVADADGNLVYDYLFSLMDMPNDPFFSTVGGPDYVAQDIFPLDLREYVIHGAFVPESSDPVLGFVPGTDFTMDGETFGYSATLPVAAAEIDVAPVPVPAGAALLVGALGGLGLMRRRRAA